MKNSVVNKSLIFIFLYFFVSCLFAQNDYWKTCPIGSPLASFDFSKGTFDEKNNGSVTWYGTHGGIQPIEDSSLTGIQFSYKGDHPLGDSSSEWRYNINIPLSHTWEYLSIYQPKNFRHRSGVEIFLAKEIDRNSWQKGDKVESSTGAQGVVSISRDKKLYLTDITERFRKNWGNGIVITNLNNSAKAYSSDSKTIANNNKFSTQWQGKYSNSGMTMETIAIQTSEGGEIGYSYFRPTINNSPEHPARGNIDSKLSHNGRAVAFDPKDNGTVVSFVIERRRATGPHTKDGAYRIWKRTVDSEWHLIFENTNLDVYQNNNYFTAGYVFGWSNSGYDEDTQFYLLQWALWAEKPSFIP